VLDFRGYPKNLGLTGKAEGLTRIFTDDTDQERARQREKTK
jgi:hypothetical protein